MNTGGKLRSLTWTALFIALVAVATIIIRIPTPAKGYVNLGDTMIFVAALIGGPQMGLIAGGIGSALADAAGGYAYWAPWTLVIKGIEGSIAGVIAYRAYRRHGPLSAMVLAGLAIAALWMVAGYYVAGGFMYGFGVALLEVPANLLQGSASIIIAVSILGALRRLRLHGEAD